ncbi:MAG: histidinol dehydrogenase [Emergencia sp.]
MKIVKKSKERTAEDNRALRDSVTAIIDDVCRRGDTALKEYNERFDDCRRAALRVAPSEIEEAYSKMTGQELADLEEAKANIKAFAKAQRGTVSEIDRFSPRPGIFLGHRIIPVSSCCCYVPGGGYPLYSTALMLITPAKVAGVKRVTACAPTVKGTSKIHYKTLVAMDLAGADEIYAVGARLCAFSYGRGNQTGGYDCRTGKSLCS